MQQPLKILIVEDEMSFALDLEMLVDEMGYLLVGVVDNSEEVLSIVLEQSPDLILMDIQMPVMTGLEAAKKIREKSIVPIIALTANTSKQEADKCLEIGINDYLGKPFKPQDLYAKIMSLLLPVANQV